MNVGNLALIPMKKSAKPTTPVNSTGQNNLSQTGQDQFVMSNRVAFKGFSKDARPLNVEEVLDRANKTFWDMRNSNSSIWHYPDNGELNAVHDGAESFAGEYGASLKTSQNYGKFATVCFSSFAKNRKNNPLECDFGPLCKDVHCFPVIFYTMHEMLKTKVEDPMDLTREEIKVYLHQANKNIKPYIDQAIRIHGKGHTPILPDGETLWPSW